ncbi:FcoT family thioesterase [Caballeronia sp. BR00000012568055]|uniref:FcoT family thioesterase n=1 Tax=Caballeronia sp. BR00000012568055 TaxID=2918761 RepID=UPI0023F7C1BF|nr:FcoT family thioesterase [Caballeronia sp. BR00000012568055]
MFAPQKPIEAQLAQSDCFRPIPAHLKDDILEPYKQECVYIKAAYRDTSFEKELVAVAEVCVPQTFYGSQTGHFNAVESLLCLNQLAFVSIADFVVSDEAHEFHKAIKTTCIQSFKDNVLTRTFITSVGMQFKRTLDGQKVFMRLAFTKCRAHAGMVFLVSEFAFIDGSRSFDSRPAFVGQATFAIPTM